MREGSKWSYLVRDAYGSSVRFVTVAGPARVGLHKGWMLRGPGGESRFAWVKGDLLMSDGSAISFDPPIVMLKPTRLRDSWTYEGLASSRGSEAQAAQATLSQKTETLKLGGLDRDTLLVTMSLSFQGREIEVKTWFEKGAGILRQEQRQDANLVVAMEIVEGG